MVSRSSRQERAVAGRVGGRVTPRSGAGWVTKNDVKTDSVSIEVKYTDKKSYSLKEVDIAKAERNALLDSGRDWAFIIDISGREVVVIPRDLADRKEVFV